MLPLWINVCNMHDICSVCSSLMNVICIVALNTPTVLFCTSPFLGCHRSHLVSVSAKKKLKRDLKSVITAATIDFFFKKITLASCWTLLKRIYIAITYYLFATLLLLSITLIKTALRWQILDLFIEKPSRKSRINKMEHYSWPNRLNGVLVAQEQKEEEHHLWLGNHDI